ncbi:hypothetical protein [Engelhardtia mirabilis]|uniref:hypothetical protein n=1 Tax=Engelhardtia mirabilis TaxID=2528011 RepID=UPI0011A08248
MKTYSTTAIALIATIAPIAAQDLVLSSGEISTSIQVDSIMIPLGAEVVLLKGASLRASERITIDGYLRGTSIASSAPDLDQVHPRDVETDAPAIELIAGESIQIGPTGRVVGGVGASLDQWDSRSFDKLIGGQGGDIFLSAPVVWIDGAVEGGQGGDGARGGSGGSGGSIWLEGEGLKTGLGTANAGLIGGPGGQGGLGRQFGDGRPRDRPRTLTRRGRSWWRCTPARTSVA